MGSPTGKFEIINAQRDGGHWRNLTELEAKVMLVFVSRADAETGEAFPGINGLSTDTGCANLDRLRKVIQRLEDRGLLTTIRTGGGRGNPTLRRLSVPTAIAGTSPSGVETGTRRGPLSAETGPDAGPLSPSQTGPVSGPLCNGETGPVNDVNRAGQRKQTGPVSGPRIDHVIDQGKDQPSRPTDAEPTPVVEVRRRKPPVGDHATLIRTFTDGWAARHCGKKYPFNGSKDGDAAKFILAAAGTLADATRIVDLYLDDDDAFLVKAGHSLGVLRSRLPTYQAQVGGRSIGARDAALGNSPTYHPKPGELDEFWAGMTTSTETAGGAR